MTSIEEEQVATAAVQPATQPSRNHSGIPPPPKRPIRTSETTSRHHRRLSVKRSALSRGRCPRTPGPRSEMGDANGVISSPGQAEPYPRTSGGGKGSLDRPSGQTLAATGEPGVAQEVPDRGDDLTPCPLRARRGSEPGGTAVTDGQGDTVAGLEEGR
jgi:hypothetical protein